MADQADQKAEREKKADEARALEEAQEEVARHANKAKVITRFGVDKATVEGVEEERWPDDFPVAELRGQIKTAASVKIGFDQVFTIAGLVTLPDGNAVNARTQLLTTTHIAEGMNPDLAIAMGEFLVEEGKRVKETMKEQPLDTSALGGLSIASSEADIKAAAAARQQIEQLAEGQPPTT